MARGPAKFISLRQKVRNSRQEATWPAGAPFRSSCFFDLLAWFSSIPHATCAGFSSDTQSESSLIVPKEQATCSSCCGSLASPESDLLRGPIIMASRSNGAPASSKKPLATAPARPAKRQPEGEHEGEHEDDLPREPGEVTGKEARSRRKTKEMHVGEVEPEPDSILVLSDDAIQGVIKYLPPADLSSFEACVRLRCLITPRWDELLFDAEKRTKARRPVPDDGFYCSKLSLMYLLRSVDRAVDAEERTRAGERSPASREELFDLLRSCDHAFVRISVAPGARNADGASSRLAWQGFVASIGERTPYLGEDRRRLALLGEVGGEEVSLFTDLFPHAKALRFDLKAFQRGEISWSEWYDRNEAASEEVSEQVAAISVVATRIDRENDSGAIVSESITSSRINGRSSAIRSMCYVDTAGIIDLEIRSMHYVDTPGIIDLEMLARDSDILLYCDDTIMRFRSSLDEDL